MSFVPSKRPVPGDETLPPSPGLVGKLLDEALVCTCRRVTKGTVKAALVAGFRTVKQIQDRTGAGGGCGSCEAAVGELIAQAKGARCGAYLSELPTGKSNKVERLKQQKDGLDCLPDVERFASSGVWQDMSEEDQQRFKWHGLFFGKQTPGHFMMRVRITNGLTNAPQFRLLADLADEYGKGFCDLTTRQQVQLRWLTIHDVPRIWKRLAMVGLTSRQTGMDNIRNVCGCPVAGLTSHELFDASTVCQEFTDLFLDNREYSNLPRKFNVAITGCLENCCHAEAQDLALVPAYRELNGQQVNGFNVLVGGKQGSGGYVPASPLNVFVPVAEAAELCGQIVKVFRDHGPREQRHQARLAFLIQERGIDWFRAEVEKRWADSLWSAGTDLRKRQRTDHLGIHPQKRLVRRRGPQLHYAGLLVPVGRMSTVQMRGIADLAERYGDGDVRLSVQQNVIVPNIPEDRLAAFTEEPLLRELPFDPSPIMRGLVTCTGTDYCHMAQIDTKEVTLALGRELERRTAGKKVLPLTIHLSGCSAGCALHQTATIGLQACRTRINGEIVEAAHVCVNGKSGPGAQTASDLMYDVPCAQLAEVLEPLVQFLPRS